MWIKIVKHIQDSIVVERLRKTTPKIDAEDCQFVLSNKPFDLILKQLGL